MPRAARLDSPGTLHHVIIRGIEKRQIVDDYKDREIFIEKLGRLSILIPTLSEWESQNDEEAYNGL
jgi:hypothetical protein